MPWVDYLEATPPFAKRREGINAEAGRRALRFNGANPTLVSLTLLIGGTAFAQTGLKQLHLKPCGSL